MSDLVAGWLIAAIEDAKRRGLPELQPLLEGLARSTQALRDADPTREPDAPVAKPADPAS